MQFFVVDENETKRQTRCGVIQTVFRPATDDEVIREGQKIDDARLLHNQRANLAKDEVLAIYPDAIVEASSLGSKAVTYDAGMSWENYWVRFGGHEDLFLPNDPSLIKYVLGFGSLPSWAWINAAEALKDKPCNYCESTSGDCGHY